MNGLAPHTASIFEAISQLECIKPYILVGGTALSLQLGTRESEDLDFMSWRKSRNEKREVDWPQIKKELESVGLVEKCDILDIDHVEFKVNCVKVSFYANPNYSPVRKPVACLNNIVLADKTAIGAMKMEVMLRRSQYRDYYDIYSLLEAGEDLEEMMSLALKYSGHKLKTKNLIALLTRSDRFIQDDNFSALHPAYKLSSKDIERRIIAALSKV
ncbi:MAG: nucleotidyl transferase AbiEii/AbiGii toxin family protein [Muribaculaceae bacterium]|uniref:nucleotidyl transferase AbiEii/AbiGii toxin family protein n=1 Tax=uncultured Duncaniella sp. TaxID=2768039 RepID=UPI00262D3BC9|nr:nucleotidyl transferase AbiEii/AbiGii toxin family protein [uncultured Duncaniella sp.]MCI9053714.1 nucleotidyl transferase AbiEii/AbiGii toxin family protein [Muribaculaceae bacterium]